MERQEDGLLYHVEEKSSANEDENKRNSDRNKRKYTKRTRSPAYKSHSTSDLSNGVVFGLYFGQDNKFVFDPETVKYFEMLEYIEKLPVIKNEPEKIKGTKSIRIANSLMHKNIDDLMNDMLIKDKKNIKKDNYRPLSSTEFESGTRIPLIFCRNGSGMCSIKNKWLREIAQKRAGSKQGMPSYILGDSLHSSLDDHEYEFASVFRLFPREYLEAKRILLSSSQLGSFNKSMAQKMMNIDVNKVGKIFDFLRVRNELIFPNEDGFKKTMEPVEILDGILGKENKSVANEYHSVADDSKE
eukprot:GHVP01060202.1.p1 GENE.GHVP01060202.1~~GHVP01060202.1.p1  ORF type:complete len:299 (+),score=60.91 GHVP01060202.1:88-984(+)